MEKEQIKSRALDHKQAAYELCLEIEKLPASEQQTAVSVRASALCSKLQCFAAELAFTVRGK